MARFSPRDYGFTPVPGLINALGVIAQSGAAAQEAVRRRGREDADLEAFGARQDRLAETHEVGLAESGFRRGTAPRQQVPDARDIFAGARPGLAGERTPRSQGIFTGERPGLAAGSASAMDDVLGLVAQRGARRPEVVVLPGQFVDGMGFARQALTDEDLGLVPHTRERFRVPRTETVPGTEQVTDELFRDRRPELGRREEFAAALGRIQGGRELSGEQLAAALEGGVPASALFGEDEPAGRRRTGIVRSGGRNVLADLDSGEVIEEFEPLPRAGGGAGGDDPGSREVTRRVLGLGAARAVAQIQDELAGSALWPEPGRLSARVLAAIRPFGFSSVQELADEMRALRLGDLDQSVEQLDARAAEAGGQLTDADIDALIRANPDLTDAQILELLQPGA